MQNEMIHLSIEIGNTLYTMSWDIDVFLLVILIMLCATIAWGAFSAAWVLSHFIES